MIACALTTRDTAKLQLLRGGKAAAFVEQARQDGFDPNDERFRR